MDSKPTLSATAQRMAAALLVAIGFAITWGLVWGWLGSLAASWTTQSTAAYDNIMVRRDGTPLIMTYSYTDYQNVSYRTLEGKVVTLKSEDQLQAASLTAPAKPQRFFGERLGWGQSLAASDFALPRGAWYLVRNDRPIGRAVFMGYDVMAKRPIGYLSRQGFSYNLPSEEDWFDVGRSTFGYSRSAASQQQLSMNGPPDLYDYNTEEELLIPMWLVYLIDGDELKEINLRKRTVRTIFESSGLVSVSILSELKFFTEPATDAQLKQDTEPRLAVRSTDRLFVINPGNGDKREFALPEQFRDLQLTVFSIAANQLLLDWTDREGEHWRETLAWLDPDGTISRQETPHLSQYDVRRSNERLEGLLAVGLAPIPVGWAIVTTVLAPLGEMQNNDQPTYAAALHSFLDKAWPALIAVTIVGCIAAWMVLRWQRLYFRPRSFAWATFAFLLGLPGLAAYWLEHRRAKLEACSECAANVPRDRDACARCNAPFAAPPLVGTEIFA